MTQATGTAEQMYSRSAGSSEAMTAHKVRPGFVAACRSTIRLRPESLRTRRDVTDSPYLMLCLACDRRPDQPTPAPVPAPEPEPTELTLDDVNESGRLLDPDGWIDVTTTAAAPVVPAAPVPAWIVEANAMACCGRPYTDHPHGDPTMHGTCSGPHAGVEITMHWNGRSYVCGLCALDTYHAKNPTEARPDMTTADLTPATPTPAGDDADHGSPFVRVAVDKPTGRAVVALDAAAIDALLHYLDDLGPGYDLTMNPGSYGVDDATAHRVADVIGRVAGPLRKLQGYL